MKVLIGGGGTGGHVFPAIAIAQALRRIDPQIDILFVGAKDKIEMEKVPAAGFNIIGLPAAGFQRKKFFKNLSLPFKLLSCMIKSRKIIKDFAPDIAVGVGGYASGPILRAASKQGVPIVLQEQNSHAGVTNQILSKKASRIFTAYDGMEKYFDKDKIFFAGNPVRADIANNTASRDEALEHFGLSADKPVVLSVGGSLGAGTINKSIMAHIDEFDKAGIQVIWQTGKYYYDNIMASLSGKSYPTIHPMAFVKRMDLAYKAADIVVSRSGALSVSELCIAAKPVIFVPSPNVAEDHQTKNAMALVNKNAAALLRDSEAESKLFDMVSSLLSDKDKQKSFSENIASLAVVNSADLIAKEIVEMIK
ncbi:MAG: undecaprenyldiphospho-muramoylpentapeptide beta-N-acetylglucosaminyltransferase [Bacteroidales bacterium]|nr:undecaprenyldiphospho-muramoylpentapeptide beta-N-acetylglucosaminyltransferase [Bacteroidales bacterium]